MDDTGNRARMILMIMLQIMRNDVKSLNNNNENEDHSIMAARLYDLERLSGLDSKGLCFSQ